MNRYKDTHVKYLVQFNDPSNNEQDHFIRYYEGTFAHSSHLVKIMQELDDLNLDMLCIKVTD